MTTTPCIGEVWVVPNGIDGDGSSERYEIVPEPVGAALAHGPGRIYGRSVENPALEVSAPPGVWLRDGYRETD